MFGMSEGIGDVLGVMVMSEGDWGCLRGVGDN